MPSTGGCKNSFHPQKARGNAFDKYSMNAEKSNPQIYLFCQTPTNAQKRLSVPSFAKIGIRRCPAADLRHLVRYNGICADLRCLFYPAIAVKQTAKE